LLADYLLIQTIQTVPLQAHPNVMSLSL
jgi:hypothetical protein